MSAEIISIQRNSKFLGRYNSKWESRITKWREAEIKRAGGWLRGNKYNIRPHLHPSNIALNRWYIELRRAYALKAKIDLITYEIENKFF